MNVKAITLVTVLAALSVDGLRIGAFNIQTYGKTKNSKEELMSYIEQIVRRYDVLLVQEIRDSTGFVITDLLNRLTSNGEEWGVVYSDRLGRSSYKEQYAYYFRSDRLSVISTYQFDDGEDDGSDWFAREPYGALFYSPTTSVSEFGMMGIHTAPGDAAEEVGFLSGVYWSAVERWGTENLLLMGDFNADCSYIRRDDWPLIDLRTDEEFLWLIDDHVDTTVSTTTDCAYDRIVARGDRLKQAFVRGSAGEFRFDDYFGIRDNELAKDISDHYPVEVEIR